MSSGTTLVPTGSDPLPRGGPRTAGRLDDSDQVGRGDGGRYGYPGPFGTQVDGCGDTVQLDLVVSGATGDSWTYLAKSQVGASDGRAG